MLDGVIYEEDTSVDDAQLNVGTPDAIANANIPSYQEELEMEEAWVMPCGFCISCGCIDNGGKECEQCKNCKCMGRGNR